MSHTVSQKIVSGDRRHRFALTHTYRTVPSVAHEPAVHKLVEVGGGAARRPTCAVSTLTMVAPDDSALIIPNPGSTDFEL